MKWPGKKKTDYNEQDRQHPGKRKSVIKNIKPVIFPEDRADPDNAEGTGSKDCHNCWEKRVPASS